MEFSTKIGSCIFFLGVNENCMCYHPAIAIFLLLLSVKKKVLFLGEKWGIKEHAVGRYCLPGSPDSDPGPVGCGSDRKIGDPPGIRAESGTYAV